MTNPPARSTIQRPYLPGWLAQYLETVIPQGDGTADGRALYAAMMVGCRLRATISLALPLTSRSYQSKRFRPHQTGCPSSGIHAWSFTAGTTGAGAWGSIVTGGGQAAQRACDSIGSGCSTSSDRRTD